MQLLLIIYFTENHNIISFVGQRNIVAILPPTNFPKKRYALFPFFLVSGGGAKSRWMDIFWPFLLKNHFHTQSFCVKPLGGSQPNNMHARAHTHTLKWSPFSRVIWLGSGWIGGQRVRAG